MLELEIAVVEGDWHALEISLEIWDLFVEGVNFSLGVSFVSDFEGVDFLGEHEDSVLGHVLGCMRWVVRE